MVIPKRTRISQRAFEKVLPKERVLPIFRRLGIGLLVFEHENPSLLEEWLQPVKQSPNLVLKWQDRSEKQIPDPLVWAVLRSAFSLSRSAASEDRWLSRGESIRLV